MSSYCCWNTSHGRVLSLARDKDLGLKNVSIYPDKCAKMLESRFLQEKVASCIESFGDDKTDVVKSFAQGITSVADVDKERLHLFKANVLEEGSFYAAFDGLEGVFHTASSFYQKVTYPHVRFSNTRVPVSTAFTRSCLLIVKK